MDIKADENTVIVFDLDDTLYNEVDYLRSVYMKFAKELEPDSWQQLFAHIFSLYRNKLDAFEYISTTYNLSKLDLISSYRTHIPHIKPFDGVLRTFDKIKGKNAKIAIITDGRKRTQMNKVDALGLTPYLDHIVISEEIGSEKPDKRNYRAIEERFNKTSYYYIADNVKKDFVTPNGMGWQTIALMDRGLNIHANAHLQKEQEYLPHNYISSFSEITIS
ncbi:Putative FMN hydrolase; 5-Amino-6-(5'-phosphoribitylamino)uracil phosphatase [hydrothermal vent metagenome]|uniref:FMN hydrolase 5-Amino-6-(5'-phosphoribitylamino)uracil phosphatase n=1 Tax=hydrothermal vent metagenome TaxID=652676 RepID=A0A3B0TT31_9ZZZZ